MTYFSKILIMNPFDHFEIDPAQLMLTPDMKVPLIHWPVAPNFGDLLSPWLIQKMTGRETFQNKGEIPSYIAIGSILKRAKGEAVVWGSGAFGTEQKNRINKNAKYCSVRGPLTRSLIRNVKAPCPKVYGDPALLTPCFFSEQPKKKYKTGLVIRWSETAWKKVNLDDSIKLIDLKTSDIEGTLHQFLSCERIVTSSLHGLIIADAYGIPNAWIGSESPQGGEFKFYDYFLSVDKLRHAQEFNPPDDEVIDNKFFNSFSFDARDINFDPYKLLDACPFLKRK